MQLLKSLKFRSRVIGVTHLLGQVYVITEKSADVFIYAGHCSEKVPICGMIPVDIAVNYSDISVNVLDDGNGCIWPICQDHTVEKVINLAQGNLLSMSLTPDGRLTVIQKNSEILLFDEIREVRNEQETSGRKPDDSEKDAEDKDGKAKDGRVTYLRLTKEVTFEKVVHAVQVAPEEMVVCDGTKIARITSEGELLSVTEGTGYMYLTVDRNGNIIACNQSNNQVHMVDSKTLEKKSTLLTLDRDGVESPQRVHCVLENSLLLVGWLNFVDVFSFTEANARGYLSATEQDVPDQRSRGTTELDIELGQSETYEDTSLQHRCTYTPCLEKMTPLYFPYVYLH